MKIGLRSGHSPNCKGAVGLRDEQTQMRELYGYVAECLINNGHEVVNCNSDEYNQNDDLYKGVYIANNNNVDYFISLHMNSFNGQANGTETWVYSAGCRAEEMAKRIVNQMSKLGFQNRGVKYSDRFYEMRNTKAPNIIIETCFCDSQKDISIWSPIDWRNIALTICKGIDPKIEKYAKEENKQETKEQEGTFYRVICGSYKDRNNAEKRKQDLEKAGFDGVFLDAFKK